jgi:hypothetical protein
MSTPSVMARVVPFALDEDAALPDTGVLLLVAVAAVTSTVVDVLLPDPAVVSLVVVNFVVVSVVVSVVVVVVAVVVVEVVAAEMAVVVVAVVVVVVVAVVVVSVVVVVVVVGVVVVVVVVVVVMIVVVVVSLGTHCIVWDAADHTQSAVGAHDCMHGIAACTNNKINGNELHMSR